MKQYIVILLVVIILVICIYHLNNKKEHYALSPTLDIEKIKETVRQYYYNKDNRQIENLNVNKDIELLNKTLSQWLIEFKYPIGSYYVQYPDINQNYSAQTETVFPLDKSPEQLFGGVWDDQHFNQGVYYRTGGTLSQEGRTLGLQDWALKNMYGWTSWSQANYNDFKSPYSGVFSKIATGWGGTEENTGNDRGTYNKFSSDKAISDSYTGEARVKNRLIRVWRRVR